jgi:LPPG:FO 2-phospho-L-lactate transferase
VGAARLLAGLVRVRPPSALTAIVNVGDDVELHGLHISPDLDTVTYTVAGAIDPDRGWGLAGESWHAMEALRRYPAARTWFNLGDRDLATHLYRTDRLRAGAPLSTVTAEIAAAWDLGLRLLPASDDPVRTRVTIAEGEVGFQEYFVQRHHDVPVSAVRFDGIEDAAMRGRYGAVLAVLGALLIPFIHLSVYLFSARLHPMPVVLKPDKPSLPPEMLTTFLLAFVAITLFCFALIRARYRIAVQRELVAAFEGDGGSR